MALLRLISLGALAVVGAVAVAPSTAHACSFDDCAESPEFSELRVSQETVTTDGVLLLSSRHGDSDALTPEAAIARMSVVVLAAQDVELSGTIEHTAGQYFWRPDAPLAVGATLSVSVSMEANPDDLASCGAGAGGDSTVTVLDETLPALALPSVELTTEYRFAEDVEFDTAVCCDDGTVNADSCNTPGFSSTGFCVAPSGTGYASASVTLGELPANLGSSVAVDYLIDGEASQSRDGLEPLDWYASRPEVFDVQIRITSLIDGSTLESDAITVDGDNPEGLGAQVVDVAAELAANCEGEPYTCENLDDYAWDTENCTPYDDGGTDSDTDSGGSDSDSGGSDSDSDSGGSDSDSGGSDSDSGGSDSAGSGSDTDGDPGQDDDGGGCSVGGSGLGGAGFLLFGLGALRRRRE